MCVKKETRVCTGSITQIHTSLVECTRRVCLFTFLAVHFCERVAQAHVLGLEGEEEREGEGERARE